MFNIYSIFWCHYNSLITSLNILVLEWTAHKMPASISQNENVLAISLYIFKWKCLLLKTKNVSSHLSLFCGRETVQHCDLGTILLCEHEVDSTLKEVLQFHSLLWLGYLALTLFIAFAKFEAFTKNKNNLSQLIMKSSSWGQSQNPPYSKHVLEWNLI